MIQIFSFVVLVLTIVMAPIASAENKVRAELISSTQQVVPDTVVWVGLSLDIEPGWNTYWKNAGATGLPPSVVLSDGSNNIEPKLQFPLPSSKPFGDDTSLLTYGYVNAVVHPFQIRIPKDVSGTWTIEGYANWLVCKDICIPERQSVSLSLPIVTNDSVVQRSPEAILIHEARGLVPTDYPGRSNFVGSNTLWIENLQGSMVTDVMPEESGEVFGVVKNVSWNDQGVFVTMDRDLLVDDFTSTHWIIAVDGSGVRIPFDRDLMAPRAAAQSNVSLALILVMALSGGLILNLMPCVFPVLSIKALSIASMVTKERTEIQKNAWLYTSGILATMVVLAGLMVGLKAGGSQIGWGFQLQTPWFVAVLVYMFVLISLWLYGWIEFGGTLSGVGQELTEGSSGRAEFFTGVLAVMVATPCTAPFMGVAMGYTLTQPWWITIAVFSALGLGLASPMLLFAIRPALVSKLPRPGTWMVRFKQFLSFPILATAIWLIWVLIRQTRIDALVLILGGCLTMVFGFWLMKGESKLSKGLSICSLIITLATLPLIALLTPLESKTVLRNVNFEAYSHSALVSHLVKERSVFINMTADWCITCKVTEKRLLNTVDVANLFKRRGVVRMTGDWTRYDPNITQYLNQFDRVGVPLYVLNHPGREPIVLSQFPTYDELERAILLASP